MSKQDHLHPEHLTIAGDIPAFIWRGQGKPAQPAIIYLPGGGDTKHEVNPEARRAAVARGVAVVSFDMHEHGDRRPSDFTPPERPTLGQFLDFVEQTVRDLDVVVQHLHQDEEIDENRLGIRAISLSASAALAAIGQGLSICACLSICGSADFAASASWRMQRDGASAEEVTEALRTSAEQLARFDPLQHVEAFPPCSIMMIHGLSDRSVPIDRHRALLDALAPFYLDHPQDCVLLTHPGGHGIRPSLHRLGWEWLLERLGGRDGKTASRG